MASVKKRKFTDIDLDFTAHPVTGDIVRLYNEDAIKTSVKNLILTKFYDRPFQPELGSRVMALLFENFSSATVAMIKESIKNTIDEYEPRATIEDIVVDARPEENGFEVSIRFKIINTLEPIDVNFFLDRAA